jgi:outer membrane protein TolC
MNKLYRYIVYILLSLNLPLLVMAQNATPDSVLIESELPELHVLLDSALINSPLLKVSDKQISQVLEQIKIEKKSWSEYFSLDANAKYGLYNQLTISDITSGEQAETGVQSKDQQLNYYVGITFKMPLSDIAKKGNKLKILNDNISEKKQEREELKQQLQQLIIKEYYNLVFLSKSLKINQEILQSLTASLMKSERDFQSGTISIENYNAMLIQKSKAEENYFKVKSEYYAQYKNLELITGCKF